MTDPTEMVLTGGFAATLLLFAVSAWVRSVSKETVADRISLEPAEPWENTPYQPPEELPGSPSLFQQVSAGKVPVWFYRPPDLLGAAFVFLVFGYLVRSALRAPEVTEGSLHPQVLLVNIGFQFIMAGVVAIFALRRVGPVEWLGLRWPAWHWILLIAPCSVLFMWAIFGGLQYSGYMEWMESLGVETVQDTVQLLQKSDDPLILGLMAFAAVVAAPLCEEVVFRGYFYPVLKRFSGAWPGAICSAIVFSAAHGSLTAFLPLFLFGLLLVFIYEKTGSLWAPVSVHFCFNGATVLIQMAGRFFDLPLDSTK